MVTNTKSNASKLLLAGVAGAGLLAAGSQVVAHADSVTVQKNDTVWAISQKFGVSIKSVESLNNINQNSHLIFVGQKLDLPDSTKATTKSNNNVVVVKSGDSLSVIAEKYGVSVDALMKANNLNSSLILVGQKLVIPANGQVSSTYVPQTSQATAPVQKVVVPASSAPVATPVTPASSAGSVASSSVATSSATVASSSVAPSSAATSTSSAAPASSSVAPSSAAPASSSVAPSSAATSTSSAAPASSSVAPSSAAPASSAATHTNTSSAATSSVAPSSAAPASSAATANVQQDTSSVTALARSLANNTIPYVWGGKTTSGFDCSGFVSYVYQHAAGVSIPSYTVAMESYVTKESVSAAQPGDLLFWGSAGATYHVGIYLGNNQYAAAPTYGQNVKVQSISSYFYPSFAGHVR